MSRRRSPLILALAVSFAFMLSPADAHADGDFGPSCPVTVDDSGDRTWSGTPDYALESEANRLATLVDSHPESLAMAAICSDLSGLILYGSTASPLGVTGVKEFLSTIAHPVSYVVVSASRQTLDAKSKAVQARLAGTGKSFVAGGDYAKGSVSVQPLIVEGSLIGPITAAEVFGAGSRSGGGACHSGSTTGELCRYHVDEVNRYPTIEGVLLAHMTRLIHDNMETSNPRDCDGWQPGDSGGAIYHAYDSTYTSVRYDGLVMGTSWYWIGTQKRCSYWFTQLSGVRAWNSGVTF